MNPALWLVIFVFVGLPIGWLTTIFLLNAVFDFTKDPSGFAWATLLFIGKWALGCLLVLAAVALVVNGLDYVLSSGKRERLRKIKEEIAREKKG
jgi:flagellar biosynthesis protein FlhB